jgi:uncharacterized protein YodC (DUF2158 family)
MSERPFNPGDVVQLRSGGPAKTVESIGSMYDAEIVNCVWFDGKKQMRGQFPPATLKHYERVTAREEEEDSYLSVRR